MTSDQTLADSTPADAASPFVRAPEPETVLDLDEVMSSARRVEKVAHICLRGDLQAEFDQKSEELGDLVDSDGRVLAEGDRALADGARAQELQADLTAIKAEMKTAMRSVRFRALPDDEWREFHASHLNSAGNVKDLTRFNNEIIAKTAIAPTMTIDAIVKLRKTLGPTQITTLANAAFWACTTGGVDIPKSLTYLPYQKQDLSETS
ncbi:MAG TPA: hypothetical protein VF642_12265 [Propionibacteriaceae bacterium]|jgi:hypothetical protein